MTRFTGAQITAIGLQIVGCAAILVWGSTIPAASAFSLGWIIAWLCLGVGKLLNDLERPTP